MNTIYKFLTSESKMTCVLRDDGKWKVTQVLIHKRSIDGATWEQRALEMSSYSSNIDRAVADVLLSIEIYLEKVNFDMFSIEELGKERLN